MTPTTKAGRALLDWNPMLATLMIVGDVPIVLAIEAEAAELDVVALAKAIAQSLVTDGYIDLDRNDGELYLNGEPNKARGDDIRLTAESIAAAYREALAGEQRGAG